MNIKRFKKSSYVRVIIAGDNIGNIKFHFRNMAYYSVQRIIIGDRSQCIAFLNSRPDENILVQCISHMQSAFKICRKIVKGTFQFINN